MIRPMPTKFGIGFTSNQPVTPEVALGYRYEQVGQHHNYYVTAARWKWPIKYPKTEKKFVIDGFSPNLNKLLHVGHLRNLAIANSLFAIVYNGSENAKFVTMLGASLGVKKAALDGWRHWTKFLGYKPDEYYDVCLPDDVVETHPATTEGMSDPLVVEPQVWDGPKGEVIVKRSDGKPLYAFHDLSFANYVGPTHYITGLEQKEHFESLGLGNKHLPMGLVLGDDNKKLKSRTGDALLATEMIQMIIERLHPNDDMDVQTKLAWNVLAWNFLHTTREKNVKFDAESWTKPDQGGLYVTYTYARVLSALSSYPYGLKKVYPESVVGELKEIDISLMGFAEQFKYYFSQSMERLDPAPIANFAYDLARMISQAYETEKISGGRPNFRNAIEHATWRLQDCMEYLGMFLLAKI